MSAINAQNVQMCVWNVLERQQIALMRVAAMPAYILIQRSILACLHAKTATTQTSLRRHANCAPRAVHCATATDCPNAPPANTSTMPHDTTNSNFSMSALKFVPTVTTDSTSP